MPRVLRNCPRVSYNELEEPSFDEYLFCSSCGDFVYEYCAIHGPLLVIPDDEVSTPTGFPAFVPRAALTIPRTFLHLAPSTIPGAGIGVFSTLTLPRGVRFGPYRGMKTDDASSPYCWQIFDRSHKPAHVLDACDANKSNWMRYVNCSRHASEQNLVAYQYFGKLYYRTIKVIPRFTELLVFYGSESATELNVDVARYNAPAYKEVLVKYDPGTEEQEKSQNTKVEPDSTTSAVDEEHMRPNTKMPENTNTKYSNNVANKKQSNDSKAHENRSHQKMYICDYCRKIFNRKDNLIAHIANHSTVKDINVNNIKRIQKPLCSICGSKFFTKTNLINHLVNIHGSKMDYKACTECDYKTVHKEYLRKHIKIHSVRKHICDSSYETCTKNCNKQLHCEKNSCTICGSNFPNKRMLNMHLITHTGNHPTCIICRIAFKNRAGLQKHLIIHSTKEKPFQCNICNKRFNRRGGLNRHVALH